MSKELSINQIIDIVKFLGIKWIIPIIYQLSVNEILRYNQLKHELYGVTNIALSKALKSLEERSLILRNQFNEIPPRVEYSLTDKGKEVLPLLHCFTETLLYDTPHYNYVLIYENTPQGNYDVNQSYKDIIDSLDAAYIKYYNSTLNIENNRRINAIASLKQLFIINMQIISKLSPAQIYIMGKNFSSKTNLLDYLMASDRPFYNILQAIIKDGYEHGEISPDLTVREIIIAYTNFSKGMIVNWRESDFSYDLLDQNKNIIERFFNIFKP